MDVRQSPRCIAGGHTIPLQQDLLRRAVREGSLCVGKFYTEVMGFSIPTSTTAPDAGGTVFPRCAADHHGVALSAARGPAAWRVPPHGVRGLDTGRGCGPAIACAADVEILRGPPPRRRAACHRVQDPDGHNLESTGASTRSAATARCVRPRSGRAPPAWRRRSPIPWSGRTPRCRTVRCCIRNPSCHGRRRRAPGTI